MRVLLKKFHAEMYKLTRSICVRFGPSPTGHLHLGGLRTALYNFLLAKKMNGRFILRIEDTDQARVVPGAAHLLENMLNWAGIEPNESPILSGPYKPYSQSERVELYNKHVNELLENGSAYRCFCSQTRLDLIRKDALRLRQTPKYDGKCRHLPVEETNELVKTGVEFVVRLKMKDEDISFDDIIFGKVTFNIGQIEGDPIILKSDKFPTYHLANVVDDHLMEVSHVLRGSEWLASTPKHIQMYNAFGWKPPIFAHLPLIINKDGKKLSKRQGDIHIETLKNQGYFPEAIINFLVDIGGGFGKLDDQLLSLNDLTQKFELSKMNSSSGKMDMEKLNIYNKKSIANRLTNLIERDNIIQIVQNLIQNHFKDSEQELSYEYIAKIVDWSQNESRINTLNDFLKDDFRFIWLEPKLVSTDLDEKSTKINNLSIVLEEVIELFSKIYDEKLTKEEIFPSIKLIASKQKIKTSNLMRILRLVLSGLSEGPPVADMFDILGATRSIKRLRKAQSILKSEIEVK